jgi:hypothetical protein
VSGSAGQDQPATFPVVIDNPPGLSAISYRVGDYTSFREALLQNLPGEVELQGWRPTADGDLTLQLLEWWAYIADILTFYNERIANGSFLGTVVLRAGEQPQIGPAPAPAPPAGSSGTASLPDNATLLARVVGFRPTPGLAASGQLAVFVNTKTAISLPPLFAVQSKPGPGQQPQVFEAEPTADTYLPTDAGGAVPVDLSCATFFSPAGVTTGGSPPLLPARSGPLLKGTITSIKPNDVVVVAQNAMPFSHATSFAATVATVAPENDPRGHTNARLGFRTFTLPPSFTPTSPGVTSCQVLRSIQSSPTYGYDNAAGNAPVVTGLTPATAATAPGLHLASLARNITVGDLVVLEVVALSNSAPGSGTYVTAAVTGYQETIWYANAADPVNNPEVPPATPENVVPIPIPHTFLTLEGAVLTANVGPQQTVARVWYGYRRVSELLDEMPDKSIPRASDIAHYVVHPAGVVNTNAAVGTTVLLEGADALGAVATLTAPITAGGTIALASSDSAPLTLPLRLLFNIFNVTAGKTVSNEVLGNGDATAVSQSFTLQKSPLTYFKAAAPVSTLKVLVDNIQWIEVSNFNDQPPDAKVFVTQEDKSQKTTVTFGDGIHGARLTTGTGNVTASYRYGSGPGDPKLGGPAPGTLVTVLTPQPGLGSVRNPVPMSGGAAPTTPTQVQKTAPSSTLTFGRAISPDDYEAIAARAPSVTRARARSAWDQRAQRTAVTVYVGGGPDAVAATEDALATAADPNCPVIVRPGTEVDLQIALIATYDPAVDPTAIRNGVVAALTDPVTGVFAPSRIGIGDNLYDSQIYAACQLVAGVRAVRGLTISDITNLSAAQPANAPVLTGVVHSPGAGGFFTLAPAAINLTLEVGNG